MRYTHRWLPFVVFGFALIHPVAYADDYERDPAPYIAARGEPVLPYSKATDPQVCDLYLQNLRYFARRNEPLSCDQPVAPSLKGKIEPVEWENLDPGKYPDLFKLLVRRAQHMDEPTYHSILSDEQVYASARKAVKNGSYVFGLAKLTLKGFPAFFGPRHRIEHVSTETPFQIVQYGPNVLDPRNPSSAFRCKPDRGRRMSPGIQSAGMRFYVVTKNLNSVYSALGDELGWPTDVWVINGKVYGEFFNQYADVRLSQLQVKPEVRLDPICLYHFRQSTQGGEKP